MKKWPLVNSLVILPLVFLTHFAKAEVIETVVFTVKENVKEKQVIESAKQMKDTIKSWNGFISRELVSLGDGKYIDIVHWRSMEEAKLAQETALKSDICLQFFGLINEQQQQFYQGSVVLKQKNKF